ncbi:Type 1 glutamine amidotransferase-like domain-containing protein [Thermomicrobium sp. 4228-Ro]|uniref:Type 1 glutamine amidotransferase-like domain-containing protein n=1 Tax=Thermomicrobium sp. 4228-Ro TaxID=2993937 RepID=UPI0022488327|nr:Type 1 glutamine amidotransferase-like domain-containing protein [Thermomicrobium sp. 4228-Ro]MCX2726689.1 Type 1 glutamine amidotransferase-like domain-containing protein [Thermomicrobium sp. 4228-Ro]
MTSAPGPIALIGSGETARAGRQAFTALLESLPRPVRIAILETPAGFQPNAALVARKIGTFLREHLPEFQPDVRFVPARRRGTVFDPDEPLVVEPVEWADCVFAGPGSPTYMVRQLAGTRTWQRLLERWQSGLRLAFASAAAIAVSRFALPVYELYKVGADLHWVDGLDLLGPLSFTLAIVPHWNNREGGQELDTSRCFMGQERFAQLVRLLPPETTILGIDEHTACLLDFAEGVARVLGAGTVTIAKQEQSYSFRHGAQFPLALLRSIATTDGL